MAQDPAEYTPPGIGKDARPDPPEEEELQNEEEEEDEGYEDDDRTR